MKNKLRHLLLKIFFPFSKAIAKIEFTFGRLPTKFLIDAMIKVQPGDIIISYIRFNLVNIFIEGRFSHAGIMISRAEVVEAIGKCVSKTPLAEFLKTKDEVVILRKKDVDLSEGLMIATQAKSFLGKPYDYDFSMSQAALYCAELCYHSIHNVFPEWTFTPRKVWDEETILPQDFLDAKAHFDIILDSREYTK